MRCVRQNIADIVGNHDDRNVLLAVDAADELVHFVCHDRVKASDRLIEEQQFLCGAKRTSEKHTLLLAAGEITVASFL